jgi:uncharacterized protein (DUF1499 family)
MPYKTIALVGILLVLGVVVALALLSLLAKRPANLGVTAGRLAPCPSSPNCVCSQDADDAHHVEPLSFEGSPQEALARLKEVLASWPRTTVVTETEGYVHAECRSRLFRFVDDVEFLLDPQAKVIHVRSASRAGKGDLGVNRRRVEALRRAFAGRAGD